MVQIVQPQQTWQSALGQGLGSGIQSGVTNLLERKLQSMAQEQEFNRRYKALEGLNKAGVFGEQFTPQALEGLKYTPDALLNTILKERLRAPGEKAYQEAATRQALGEPLEKILADTKGLKGGQITQLTQSASGARKEEQRMREHGEIASREHRNKLSEEVKADEIKIAKLDKLKNLIEHEDVAQGTYGLLPGVFQNKATQEAQGLIADILLPLEGRANTDAKLKAAIDTFARLGDTKEAQLEKIERAKELAKISGLQKEAENKIIEEKGYSPFNIADLGWERSRKERDKILDNFTKTTQKYEWLTADQIPASKHAGQERIGEDGTIEHSDGKKWVKGRNPNKARL